MTAGSPVKWRSKVLNFVQSKSGHSLVPDIHQHGYVRPILNSALLVVEVAAEEGWTFARWALRYLDGP